MNRIILAAFAVALATSSAAAKCRSMVLQPFRLIKGGERALPDRSGFRGRA